jgi:hypothetical protein
MGRLGTSPHEERVPPWVLPAPLSPFAARRRPSAWTWPHGSCRRSVALARAEPRTISFSLGRISSISPTGTIRRSLPSRPARMAITSGRSTRDAYRTSSTKPTRPCGESTRKTLAAPKPVVELSSAAAQRLRAGSHHGSFRLDSSRAQSRSGSAKSGLPNLDDYFSLWRCTGYPKLGGGGRTLDSGPA